MRDDTPWQERWEERLIRAAVTVRYINNLTGTEQTVEPASQ